MKNFVIINGVNSNTINGLGINELPPISKPSMRVQQEVIDGRDGDITTNLGYSAYDKTITIGLFGTGYDINDIISFFNGEGTIVFSNEDDKYYKYKIINQIDYEALQKFKEASITFHCQPFKYPLTETPLEIEYEYIEQEGVESATLEGTIKGGLTIDPKGNTSQYSTTGKNLFNDNSLYETSNCVVNNGVCTQREADTNPTIQFKVQIYNGDTFVRQLGTIVLTSIGRVEFAFTYNASEFDRLRFGLNGLVKDTMVQTGKLTNLVDGTTYYLSAIFTNITQGSISWRDIMISSTQNDTYEPYTNGASPNPDYPQPINVVSGDNEINVEGKNLLNKDLIENGKATNNYGTPGATPNPGATLKRATLTPTNAIKVKPNTAYTFNYTNSSFDFALAQMTSDKISLGDTGWVTSTYLPFTIITNANCEYIGFNFKKSDNSDITTANFDTFISSNIQLEVGSTKTDYEPYQSQTYPIYLGVENLFNQNNYTNQTLNDRTLTNDNGKITISGTSTLPSNFETSINITPTEDMTISISQLGGTFSGGDVQFLFIPTSGTAIESKIGTPAKLTNGVTYTTARISVRPNVVCTDLEVGIQLEKGSKANHYTEYGTTPIELCKIGDYQDYFTKNSDGQWCKYNAIKKEVYDGTESWTEIGTRYSLDLTGYSSGVTPTLCNSFLSALSWTSHTTTDNTVILYKDSQWQTARLSFNYSSTGSLNNWKTWLGNNKPIIYYPSATPYLSLIEDETLISQLDNIQNAMSYEGTTNISQVNDDKAFIISAKALEQGSNEVVVNNIGNIYAKPLIALEGSGNVNIYLDNTQILQANVEDKMNIDIAQLEAYNPDTSVLLNRQVIGNYNSMTIPSGESTIKIDGALDKATISNYIRWL